MMTDRNFIMRGRDLLLTVEIFMIADQDFIMSG